MNMTFPTLITEVSVSESLEIPMKYSLPLTNRVYQFSPMYNFSVIFHTVILCQNCPKMIIYDIMSLPVDV